MQKAKIINRKVLKSSMLSEADRIGVLNSDIRRARPKIKRESPMKKGNRPGPGVRKVPKPYFKEEKTMMIPNTVRMRSKVNSSGNGLDLLMADPLSFCPDHPFIARPGSYCERPDPTDFNRNVLVDLRATEDSLVQPGRDVVTP